MLTLGGAHPGKELMDIFSGSKDQTNGATLTRANNAVEDYGTPIREDEDEHHDMEALLYEDRKPRSIRKKSSRAHLTDVEENHQNNK